MSREKNKIKTKQGVLLGGLSRMHRRMETNLELVSMLIDSAAAEGVGSTLHRGLLHIGKGMNQIAAQVSQLRYVITRDDDIAWLVDKSENMGPMFCTQDDYEYFIDRPDKLHWFRLAVENEEPGQKISTADLVRLLLHDKDTDGLHNVSVRNPAIADWLELTHVPGCTLAQENPPTAPIKVLWFGYLPSGDIRALAFDGCTLTLPKTFYSYSDTTPETLLKGV